MLKESKANEQFEYQRLSQEEQQKRGILGRLVGICADLINPTRNGRKYSEQLWENVFNDPIMKEKIANRCCFGELGHPSDRTETDMSKIAICLAEQPVKSKGGKLIAVFDILDTPNGRILKSLCDYGCIIGISSRGEGDLITDYDGQESVDPETYSCECFDAVLIPAVKEARMKYVTESLEKTRYNKTLRESLQKTLASASEDDRKVMQESLDNLGITLDEEILDEAVPQPWYAIFKRGDDPQTATPLVTRREDPNAGYQSSPTGKGVKQDILYDMNNLIKNGKGPVDTYWMWRKSTDRPGTPIRATLVLKQITDDNDLWRLGAQPLKQEVFIDRYVDHTYWGTGDTTAIDKALSSGTPVIQWVGYQTKNEIPEPRVGSTAKDTHGFGLDYLKGESLEEGNDQMTDDEILNEISGTLGFEGKDKDNFINDVKSGNGKKYASDVEAHCCDKCRARFKKMLGEELNEDIQDESLNINEAEDMAVENNEAIVEQLQESLKHNQELEQKLIELQEKLSVCYAKESKSTEEVNKYKNTIKRLAESAKQVAALQAKSSKLEEQLNEEKEKQTHLQKQLSETKSKVKYVADKNVELKESVSSHGEENNMLRESITSLNEQLQKAIDKNESDKQTLKEAYKKKLKAIKESAEQDKEALRAELNESIAQLQKDKDLQKAEFNQKIEKSKKLVEKYKKATTTAIDKYIELQAVRLGSSVSEVKSRLPESYSFDDIDRVCEGLQSYNLNMSKLPFNAISKKSITENVKIKGTSSKNESLLPATGLDDDIDEDLLYLAGK